MEISLTQIRDIIGSMDKPGFNSAVLFTEDSVTCFSMPNSTETSKMEKIHNI